MNNTTLNVIHGLDTKIGKEGIHIITESNNPLKYFAELITVIIIFLIIYKIIKYYIDIRYKK